MAAEDDGGGGSLVGVAANAPSSLESKPESGLSLPLSRLALRLAVCGPCGSIDVDGTGLSVAARRLSASSSSSCLELGQFLKSVNCRSKLIRGLQSKQTSVRELELAQHYSCSISASSFIFFSSIIHIAKWCNSVAPFAANSFGSSRAPPVAPLAPSPPPPSKLKFLRSYSVVS